MAAKAMMITGGRPNRDFPSSRQRGADSHAHEEARPFDRRRSRRSHLGQDGSSREQIAKPITEAVAYGQSLNHRRTGNSRPGLPVSPVAG